MLVYDLEIIKAIRNKKEQKIDGIEYCAGWDDHANMGISVIGVYDYGSERYRVFCKDNMGEFEKLCQKHGTLVSFNGIGFDNKLLKANGIILPEEKCYDILQQIWIGDNLEPMFEYPSHIGYGLDKVCSVNLGVKKTGNGALAPVEWQRGEIGKVIDYCLNDVKISKELLDYIILWGRIRSPKNESEIIKVKKPF